jgi:uncharacterized OB-fold protein
MTSGESTQQQGAGSKRSSDEFYEWCAAGELRLQRCNQCREWCHVPRVICPNCAARDWSWEAVSGRGRVFTWTVVHRAMHPDFMDAVPFASVVVELDEGPRILTQLVDCPAEELEMEMPVEVAFERSGERVLPKFRRITGNTGKGDRS